MEVPNLNLESILLDNQQGFELRRSRILSQNRKMSPETSNILKLKQTSRSPSPQQFQTIHKNMKGRKHGYKKYP